MKKCLKILIIGSLIFFLPVEAYAFVGTVAAAVASFVTTLVSYAIPLYGGTSLLLTSALTTIGTAYGYSQIAKALTPDVPGYSSSTYDYVTPVLTAQAGTPIQYASGICYLSGNIIRQNNFKAFEAERLGYMELLVDFGEGEWDDILATYVNDLEWTSLKNPNHVKYEHLGTDDQGTINNLFTEDACNFRNHVIAEYKIKRCGEIENISNITVVARTRKCLEIGQDVGGTESFTRNPAQVLWDFYLKKKEVALSELDVDAFTSLEEYCDVSLCYTDKTYYPVNVLAPSSDLVKATSHYNREHRPTLVVDLGTALTGHSGHAGWESQEDGTTDQRINFDFGRKVVVTRIQMSNFHNSGSNTKRGIKNFVLQGSNTAADLDHTAYDDGSSSWADVETGLQAAEHSAVDEADWQVFDIPSNTTGYRYYSLKIADNWASATFMGFRQVRFFTGNAASECSGDETNIRHAFDFNNDTKLDLNDFEKIIWQSFNGKVIMSQGVYKPVWDAADEPDGAGSLQAKAVQHNFVSGTNIVEGTLSWNKLKHPNVYIINGLDSTNGFKKISDAVCKNDQDVAVKGEVTYEEACWWLIDYCLQARRCKWKYNKGQYPDYQAMLTGFPDSQLSELFDLVTVTDTEADWSAKDFLIVGKDEDQYGRSQFLLEAYFSGIHEDRGFEQQQGYPSTRGVDGGEVPGIETLTGTNDSDNEYPDIIVHDSIFDGDRDSGGISFGKCCTLLPDGAFEFDDENTPDTIDEGGSIEVYATGGCLPLKFKTSSNGYDFEGKSASAWATEMDYALDDLVSEAGSYYICRIAHTSGTFADDLAAGYWEETGSLSYYKTWSRNATLNCASGDCGVDFDVYCDLTIVDNCGEEVETTIRNTEGGWVHTEYMRACVATYVSCEDDPGVCDPDIYYNLDIGNQRWTFGPSYDGPCYMSNTGEWWQHVAADPWPCGPVNPATNPPPYTFVELLELFAEACEGDCGSGSGYCQVFCVLDYQEWSCP